MATLSSVEEDEGPVAQRDTAVARTVAIIDSLARADAEGIGVRQLSAKLDVSRSVVHRILANLTDLGVAAALPGGRYGPGVVPVSWAALLHEGEGLLAVGGSVVSQLVEKCGEGVFLTSYAPGDLDTTIVAAQDSPKPLRFAVQIGERIPLHTGGSGKSILSRLPDSVIDRLHMEKFTDETIVDRGKLREEIQQVAAQGYAVGRGEVNTWGSGVGAAFDIDGKVAGAICISIPSVRFDQDMAPTLGARVRAAADLLTELLSHDRNNQ